MSEHHVRNQVEPRPSSRTARRRRGVILLIVLAL